MRPRAVICDDEDHIRVMLRTALKTMNVDVVGEARNGEEALTLFRREKPHILLLDINMPRKRGDEVLEEIMRDSPSALVIMLSSVADYATVESCLEKGASNYIRKDTPIAEIKQIIKETWIEYIKSGGQPLS